MKRIVLISLSLSVLIVLTQVRARAVGNVWYLSPTGNDTADCSLATPCLTLNQASDMAQAGDTVYLRAGVYLWPERQSFRATGQAGAPILITAYPTEHAILDGSLMVLTSTESILHLSGGYVVVEGLEVRNSSGRGISVSGGNNITLRNNYVHHTHYRALGGAADNIVIENNEVAFAALVNENGALGSSGWPGGISAYTKADGSLSQNWIIRNNLVHDTWGECMIALRMNGFVIENNTLRDCWGTLLYVDKAINGLIQNNLLQVTTAAYNRNGHPANGIKLAAEGLTPTVAIENITITGNSLFNTNTGIHFWFDPDNTLPTNSYRAITVTNNLLNNIVTYAIDFDVVPPDRLPPANNLLHDNVWPEGSVIVLGNPEAWTVGNNGTATPTPLPTGFPTPTATPVPVTLNLGPIADARVSEANPATNYGSSSSLRNDGGLDPDVESYLKFTVTGITGQVVNAKLRLFATTNTDNGPAVYAATNTWAETTITWNNRPARFGEAADDKGAIVANTWVEFNLTSLITGDGLYTFALTTDNDDGVDFSSREGANPPQLIVLFVPGATTTPTSSPSNTLTPAPTATPTSSALPPSATPNPTHTPTSVPTASHTPSPLPPSATPNPTSTPTPVATASPTSSPLPPSTTPTRTHTPIPSPTATQPADLIFADGFEAGNLAAWTASVTDGGDLSVSSGAAVLGAYGLTALIDDNNALYLTDDTPNAEPRYRARFYFDPNSLVMSNNNAHYIFYGYTGSATVVLRLELRRASSTYQLRAALLNDGSTWATTNWFPLTDAPHAIEIDWRASTTAGANNGGLTLWLDGAQQANLTNIDNDTRRIDRVRLGPVSGIDSGTRGAEIFDAFESRRQTYIGP